MSEKNAGPTEANTVSAADSLSHSQVFRPGFLPALEGLRAIASLGIIGTHVAFQTGHDTGALWERILGRFDFFVAVFFALSGFLLWRSHRGGFTKRHPTQASGVANYYQKRFARIMPAYWVLVLCVLIFFPVGRGAGITTWLANLTLTQVYVPDSLHGGLTHLWSLSVEVAFYIALPLLALLLLRIDPHRYQLRRIAVIAALGALSYAWIYLPLPYPSGVNPHIQPIAYFAWFTSGMIFAEAESLQASASEKHRRLHARLVRIASRRLPFIVLAIAALILASILGPEGLVSLTNWEFTRRNLCGLVFGAAIIGPWALAPQSKFFEHPIMQALGRWSYGIFLWHVALLSIVFPLLSLPLFSGHFLVVGTATVILSIVTAAASYALVEEPARQWLTRRNKK